MEKKAICLAVATLALTGFAAPASADKPTGGCPEAFKLEPISAFGPGFQAHLASVDMNADQRVCTQPLPEALPFPNINFVDNVVRQ